MSGLTREQAVALAASGWWKGRGKAEVALFQLHEERLCMDFGDFQLAVDELLGRPTWTHEYAHPENLIAEYRGEKKAPTFWEILEMLPTDKVVLVLGDGKDASS